MSRLRCMALLSEVDLRREEVAAHDPVEALRVGVRLATEALAELRADEVLDEDVLDEVLALATGLSARLAGRRDE